MTHAVSAKLCVSCKYRARRDAFLVYRCDYELIKGECRLDPPGTCSHYERDEKYNPREEWRRKAEKKAYKKEYDAKRKVKSSRPVGRPKKEW